MADCNLPSDLNDFPNSSLCTKKENNSEHQNLQYPEHSKRMMLLAIISQQSTYLVKNASVEYAKPYFFVFFFEILYCRSIYLYIMLCLTEEKENTIMWIAHNINTEAVRE